MKEKKGRIRRIMTYKVTQDRLLPVLALLAAAAVAVIAAANALLGAVLG